MMYQSNYDTTGMVWDFDVKDSFESHKWDSHALDLLEEMNLEGRTTTGSRLVGAAIQFVVPCGFVGREEKRVEQELEKEGVDIQGSEITTVSDDGFFDSVSPQARMVSSQDYYADNYEGVRMEVSLPQSLLDAVERACDESDDYNLRQKARFLSNCIIAYHDSVFDSAIERLETKLQLLRFVRGEDVEEQTHAFQMIQEGKWFDDLHRAIFVDDSEVETGAGTLDLDEITAEDDVVLPEGHPAMEMDFEELGLKKKNGRAGAFVAYLRAYMRRNDTDSLPEDTVLTLYEMKNPDYASAEKTFGTKVRPHLHEMDGQLYIDESDVPEKAVESDNIAEERSALADALIALSKQSQRGLSAALRESAPEQLEEIPAKQVRDPTRQTLITYLTADELRSAIDYITVSMDRTKQKAVVRNESETGWEDFVYHYKK